MKCFNIRMEAVAQVASSISINAESEEEAREIFYQKVIRGEMPWTILDVDLINNGFNLEITKSDLKTIEDDGA